MQNKEHQQKTVTVNYFPLKECYAPTYRNDHLQGLKAWPFCCFTNRSLLGTLTTLSNICWVTKYITKQASVNHWGMWPKKEWASVSLRLYWNSKLTLRVFGCRLRWQCRYKTHILYSISDHSTKPATHNLPAKPTFLHWFLFLLPCFTFK